MKDLSFLSALPSPQREAFLDSPAMKRPSDVPDLGHPYSNNAAGYGVVITGTVLCVLLVSLRLYSRAFYHKSFGLEDVLAVAALGAFAGFTYSVWMLVIHPGIFIHMYDIRLRDLPHQLYYMMLGSTLYGIVIGLLKTGILLEWARLFVPRGIKNGFWWTCHITIALNALFYVICTFVEIFGCNPRQKQWTPWLPGTCMNVALLNVVSSSLNFLLDVMILILPQKVIWGLNSTRQRKSGVAILFAMGIFACVSAGVRIRASVDFLNKADITYSAADMGLWCIAEMVSGFFILCLPSIPKLLKDSRWIQAIVTTFKSSSRASSQKLTHTSGKVPTIGQWRKPRRDPDSLFTEADDTDVLPLNNISVTSAVTVRSDDLRKTEGNHRPWSLSS